MNLRNEQILRAGGIASARLLGGITVGDNEILEANAVVTRGVPRYSIARGAAGYPAAGRTDRKRPVPPRTFFWPNWMRSLPEDLAL